MKIFSLEFVARESGATERIWHTNRRALERYSSTLKHSRFEVHGIRTFDVPAPLTDARMVAFLNAHCANFMPERTPRANAGNEPANDTDADA